MLISTIILSILYLGFATYKLKNIPESISETSYIWEAECDHKQWHKAHLFSIYCVLMACLIFWPWVKITPEYWQFICFLGCTGILIAGITPFFKEKYQAPIHYTGGTIIALCWIMWMLMMHHYITIVVCGVIIGACCAVKPRSWVFWFEVAGLFGLIYRLF